MPDAPTLLRQRAELYEDRARYLALLGSPLTADHIWIASELRRLSSVVREMARAR